MIVNQRDFYEQLVKLQVLVTPPQKDTRNLDGKLTHCAYEKVFVTRHEDESKEEGSI